MVSKCSIVILPNNTELTFDICGRMFKIQIIPHWNHVLFSSSRSAESHENRLTGLYLISGYDALMLCTWVDWEMERGTKTKLGIY